MMFVFVVLVVMQPTLLFFFETFLGEESFVVDAKKGLQREIRDDAEANERRFLRRGCGTRERKLEQQQKHFEQQQNAYRYG